MSDRTTTHGGDAHRFDLADDVRAPGWAEPRWAEPGWAPPAPLAPTPPDAPAPEALAPDGVTGNLRRYARWQWRDFWQRRGFWMAAAALFGVWMVAHWGFAPRTVWSGRAPVALPKSPTDVLAISHFAFAVGGVLAGLLGAGGMVARERERGLQRFLFAKPVNIVRYYAQGFAVNAAGSLLVLLGAALLTAFLAPHAVAALSLVGVGAAGYLVAAGVTFLVSTLVRFDAPVAGAWLLAGFPMVALAENGYVWARALQWLFPHAPALAVGKAIVAGLGPGASEVQAIPAVLLTAGLVGAAYGAACFAGGLAVLRRRSISA